MTTPHGSGPEGAPSHGGRDAAKAPRLTARGVSVALGRRPVLDGVTVAFEPGRITGLVGANGAGKTTLLRALAGLAALQAGQVLLGDDPLAASGQPGAWGTRIAYLPQDRHVHWPLSVGAVVALGRLPHRGVRVALPGSDGDGPAIRRAMAAMDVADFAERPVTSLSGGQLARVLMARALAQEAPVILADEPTAGLDPAHALGLFEVLTGLAARGRTVVVALHDLSAAARFCHDVVMLKAGRVAAAGSSGDVLVPERLRSVFDTVIAVGSVGGVPAIVPVETLSNTASVTPVAQSP